MMTTKSEFPYIKDNFWNLVETWAQENKFKSKQSTDLYRLYERGGWWSWNAHPSVMIEWKDGKVSMDCWINPIWGGKMEITSENVIGVWAKQVARDAVNRLLSKLNQKLLL